MRQLSAAPTREKNVWERAAAVLLLACLCYHLWGATVGWTSQNLPGGEFRQAQTGLSAYFIQQDHDFSLAYPTPVLGKPWSVPMEFPLYQWTVVGVSNGLGLSLTEAGRTVSLVCFYLALPAVGLLLRGFSLSRTTTRVALAMILISPFYMFYSRAFLIETMALMFSAWFLAAYLRWFPKGGRGWLAVAMVAGVGAGLVKVTTFMLWLVPAAVFTAVWLWRNRPGAGDTRPFLAAIGRGAAAVALPFAATLWWLRFADATKALNPAGDFLVSSSLTGFNFGNLATRVSPTTWGHYWFTLRQDLIFIPGLAAGLLALFAVDTRSRRVALGGLGCFVSAWAIFPFLYAFHEYYYVASAAFLFGAVGVAAGALWESRCPRWLALLALALIFGGQVYRHLVFYYPGQSPLSPGGNGLSRVLEATTRPHEVLVIAGDDWNSMTPFYAKRKALMIRGDLERNPAQMEKALNALAGEKVGALVLIGAESRGDGRLISMMVDKFGFDSRPVFAWDEAVVYLPGKDRTARSRILVDRYFEHVVWVAGAEPPGLGMPDEYRGEWQQVAKLPPRWKRLFQYMKPVPESFYSSFGPGLDTEDGVIRFHAHPVTRLRFALPAGDHRLQTTLMFRPGAYENIPVEQATDGVEVRLALLDAEENESIAYQRVIRPATEPRDRGAQGIDIRFKLPAAGLVELFIGPGPDGHDTRDWAVLGALTID